MISFEKYCCVILQVDAIQSLGGTGALRIGLDFLKSRLGLDVVYVSNPTWGNDTILISGFFSDKTMSNLCQI